MLAQVEEKAISERAMHNLQEFGIREVLAVNTSQGFTKQKEPVFFSYDQQTRSNNLAWMGRPM